jgi:hypothetical protein
MPNSLRLFAAVIATLVAATRPSVAQGWQEYAFVESGFAVQLPAPPETEMGTHMVAGIAVPAMIYTLRQPDITYAVTVADLTNTRADNRAAAIDGTVKALRETGEVKLDVTAEINGQYGRELTLAEKDGGRSIMALFLVNHRLYQLKGTVAPPSPERRAGNAIRFQQSLRFPGGRR